MQSDNGKRIVIFGATGLAGGGVLRACLASPEISEVIAVTRRSLPIRHPKLREVLCHDFGDLSAVASATGRVDACFYCLGIASTGIDEAEYRVITRDYALEAARALKETSPSHIFHFISGAGTNARGRMMWARVKGETEEDLKKMGLAGIVCWRPAMILGEGRPGGGSWLVRVVYPLFRLLRFIPSLSVPAESIGFAMIELLIEEKREGTVENLAIRAAAERYLGRYRAGS